MTELLTAFGTAFADTGVLALVAALVWGLLSVLLSPCHLSSIPLVVAYMAGAAEPPSRLRAAGLSGCFATGTLVSTAAVGAVTIAAGRIAGDVGRTGSYLLALVFFAMGLNLVGMLPLPSWSVPASRVRGPAGALLLGVAFGAALGPCAFAFLAPLLGMALAAGQADTGRGAMLVGLYAVGHAAAIVAAGTSAQAVQRWISWRVGVQATSVLRKAAGSAVIAAGVYFVWTAP